MSTHLLQFSDGVLVRVLNDPREPVEIKDGLVRATKTFGELAQGLDNIIRPIANAARQASSALEGIKVKEMEIEIAVGIEGEASIVIASSKASANLTLKISIEPA